MPSPLPPYLIIRSFFTQISFLSHSPLTPTPRPCRGRRIWGGWGWGWVLLGSMGLVVVQKAPKLYGLVRKPLATLHSAAETTSPRRIHRSAKLYI